MAVRYDENPVLDRGHMLKCGSCGRVYSSQEKEQEECKDCTRLRSLGLEPKMLRN